MAENLTAASGFHVDAASPPSTTPAATVVVFTDVSALMPAPGHTSGGPGVGIETMVPFSVVGHPQSPAQSGLVAGGRLLDEHSIPGTVVVVAHSASATNSSCLLVGNAQNQPIEDHPHSYSHAEAGDMPVLTAHTDAAASSALPTATSTPTTTPTATPATAAGPPPHEQAVSARQENAPGVHMAALTPVASATMASTAAPTDAATATATAEAERVVAPPSSVGLIPSHPPPASATAAVAHTNPMPHTSPHADVVSDVDSVDTMTAAQAARVPENCIHNHNNSNLMPVHHHHRHTSQGMVPPHTHMALVVSLEGASSFLASPSVAGHTHTIDRALEIKNDMTAAAAAAAAAVVATVAEHVAHDPALQHQLQEMHEMDVANLPDAVAEAAAAAVVKATGASLAKPTAATAAARRDAVGGFPRLTVTAVPAAALARAVAAATAAALTTTDDVGQTPPPLPPQVPPPYPQPSECSAASVANHARLAHEAPAAVRVALSTEHVATLETAPTSTHPSSTATTTMEAHTPLLASSHSLAAAENRGGAAASSPDSRWEPEEGTLTAILMPEAAQMLCGSTASDARCSATQYDSVWGALHNKSAATSMSRSSSQLLVQTLSCGMALGDHPGGEASQASVSAVPAGAQPPARSLLSRKSVFPTPPRPPAGTHSVPYPSAPMRRHTCVPSSLSSSLSVAPITSRTVDEQHLLTGAVRAVATAERATTTEPVATPTFSASLFSTSGVRVRNTYRLPPYLAEGSPLSSTMSSYGGRPASVAEAFVRETMIRDRRPAGASCASAGRSVALAHMCISDGVADNAGQSAGADVLVEVIGDTLHRRPVTHPASITSLSCAGFRESSSSTASTTSSAIVGIGTDLRQFLMMPARRVEDAALTTAALGQQLSPTTTHAVNAGTTVAGPTQEKVSMASDIPHDVAAFAVEADEDAPVPMVAHGHRRQRSMARGAALLTNSSRTSVASMSSMRLFAASVASGNAYHSPWALPATGATHGEGDADVTSPPPPPRTSDEMRYGSPRPGSIGAALRGGIGARVTHTQSAISQPPRQPHIRRVATSKLQPHPLWTSNPTAVTTSAATTTSSRGVVDNCPLSSCTEESGEVLPLPCFETSWPLTERVSGSHAHHSRATTATTTVTVLLVPQPCTPRLTHQSTTSSQLPTTRVTSTTNSTLERSGAGEEATSARGLVTATSPRVSASRQRGLPRAVGESLLNTVNSSPFSFPTHVCTAGGVPLAHPASALAMHAQDVHSAEVVSQPSALAAPADHSLPQSLNSDGSHANPNPAQYPPEGVSTAAAQPHHLAQPAPFTASVGLRPLRAHVLTATSNSSPQSSPTSLLSEAWQTTAFQVLSSTHGANRSRSSPPAQMSAVDSVDAPTRSDDSLTQHMAMSCAESSAGFVVETALPSPPALVLVCRSASCSTTTDTHVSPSARTVSSSSASSWHRRHRACTAAQSTLTSDGADEMGVVTPQRAVASASHTADAPASTWCASPLSTTFLVSAEEGDMRIAGPLSQSQDFLHPAVGGEESRTDAPRLTRRLSTRSRVSWAPPGLASARRRESRCSARRRLRISLWHKACAAGRRCCAPSFLLPAPLTAADAAADFFAQVPWSAQTVPHEEATREGMLTPVSTPTCQRPSPLWGSTPPSRLSSAPWSHMRGLESSFLVSARAATPLTEVDVPFAPAAHAPHHPEQSRRNSQRRDQEEARRDRDACTAYRAPWQIYTRDNFALVGRSRVSATFAADRTAPSRDGEVVASRDRTRSAPRRKWASTIIADSLLASMLARSRSLSTLGSDVLFFSFLGASPGMLMSSHTSRHSHRRRRASAPAASTTALNGCRNNRLTSPHTAAFPAQADHPHAPSSPLPFPTARDADRGSVPLITLEDPTTALPNRQDTSTTGRSQCVSAITTFAGDDAV